MTDEAYSPCEECPQWVFSGSREFDSRPMKFFNNGYI